MAWRWVALALTSAALLCAPARAQAPLLSGFGGAADFGVAALPPDDDGSSAAIALDGSFPDGLEFFGARYRELFVNNNGNVSFDMPLSDFTPMPFPVAAQPMIAAWWADVDTRAAAPAGDNRVYWHLELGRLVVTWLRVGYFDSRADLVNSMQLVLVDRSAGGAPGDFDVALRYNRLEWTTGDASGGMMGLGGTPAQAGFDAGNGRDFVSLPGSLTSAVLDLATTSNVGEPGVWRFQIRAGGITECGNGELEPGEDCDDGNTAPGDGCSARCGLERALGEPCVFDDECGSVQCVDGVCCERACGGACERCAADGRCALEPAGALCRSAIDVCDAEETCDGLAARCPPDVDLPDDTPCDDDLVCNGAERCQAGVCEVDDPLDCDDLDPCTTDLCAEPGGCEHAPIPGCSLDAGSGAADAGPSGMDAGGARTDASLRSGTPRGSGLSCGAGPERGGPGAWLLLLGLAGLRPRRRGIW